MKNSLMSLILIILLSQVVFAETAKETIDDFDEDEFFQGSFEEVIKLRVDLNFATDRIFGQPPSDDMKVVLKAIDNAKKNQKRATAQASCEEQAMNRVTTVENDLAIWAKQAIHDYVGFLDDVKTVIGGALSVVKELAENTAEAGVDEYFDIQYEVFEHTIPSSGCDIQFKVVWLKNLDKFYAFIYGDCDCKPIGNYPPLNQFLMLYEGKSSISDGKVTAGVTSQQLHADCDCDEEEDDDSSCELPDRSTVESVEDKEPSEYKLSSITNARGIIEDYGKAAEYKLMNQIYYNVKREEAKKLLVKNFEEKCSEYFKDSILRELKGILHEIIEGRRKLQSHLKAAKGNPEISTGEKNHLNYYDQQLATMEKGYKKAEKWIENFWKCHCKNSTKVSCDMDKFINSEEAYAVNIPSDIAESIAYKHINVECGMYKITSMVLTLGAGGGTTTYEIDDSSVHRYGVIVDEDGKLAEQIVDGGWEDPEMVVQIGVEVLNEIVYAEDPYTTALDAWGNTIKLKGTVPETQIKAGLLNMATVIAKKKPQIPTALAWTPPPMPFTGRINKGPGVVGQQIPVAGQPAPRVNTGPGVIGQQIPVIKPKIPSPKVLLPVAWQLPKQILKPILPKPPVPAAQCYIRGIPYNCYRGTLSISPTTVERGKLVTVKANGYTFPSSMTLIAEPVGSGSYGYTLMKINGNRVNSNTYTFNANLPAGQWMVAVIGDNRPMKDFADSKQTLTVSGMPAVGTIGQAGESCDNRKCAAGLFCGSKFVYGANNRRQTTTYNCYELKFYSSYCIGIGNTPPAYQCI